MRELDSQNGDYDLTTAQAVLTSTVPDATALADVVLLIGDGAKDLHAGTATTLTVSVTVGGVSVYGTDPTVSVAGGRSRLRQAIEPFPVAAAEEVIVTLASDNASDTDVDVTAVLRDAAPLQPLTRGAAIAVSGSGRTDVGAIDGQTAIDGQSLPATFRLLLSALVGKVSGAGEGTIQFRAADDSKPRITAEGDVYGNRTTVTLDGG